MENKSLDWWNSLSYKKKEELADKEQWTTPEQITNYQIEMIYRNIVYGN